MQRSEALKVIAFNETHHCPYKGQTQQVWRCYVRAQDPEESYCYACDHVPRLKARLGLRTHRMRLVLVRCKNCDLTFEDHSNYSPFPSKVLHCKGYEHDDTIGPDRIHVPIDDACLEWFTIDCRTGVRKPLHEHAVYDLRKFRVPLLGAPGTVPPDARDPERAFFANEAEKARRGHKPALDDQGNPITVKVKRGKRK